MVALIILLSGCSSSSAGSAPRIVVTEARTPVPASPDVGVVYFTVTNKSSRQDVLESALTDSSSEAMLHHDQVHGSSEIMVPTGPVRIGPHKSLVLQPGTFHLMLMNLTRTLHVGDVVNVTLMFQRAGAVHVAVPVVALVSGSSGDMNVQNMPAGSGQGGTTTPGMSATTVPAGGSPGPATTMAGM
ncbi:MAG TPA: copper chaperone PCu(A)C [Acidimicrobiales bacterium]|nr:copper chaperone PCu(A)C [Acidimicrobiales bacterium]